MKKLIAAVAILFAFNANADFSFSVFSTTFGVTRYLLDLSNQDLVDNTPPVTVQSSGTGDTCESALNSAKMHALEKVNGTWVKSVQRSSNGSYDEDIIQYSGGVIKSYKYLRNDCTFVIIEAEVMKRSNKVQLEAADVSRKQIIHVKGIKESQDRKQAAIKSIDSRVDAVYFSPKNTEFSVIEGTDKVLVSIDGTFAFKDKFKSDFFALREEFGYFNLSSFAWDPRIRITGFDSSKNKVFETSFTDNSQWKLWKVRTYGATNTMEVYPNKTENAKIKFNIPINELENVSSFIVEVI